MARSCPDCGASLEGAMVVHERLDDLGYKHRDRIVECPECPRQVTFGEPVDRADRRPPTCEVCGGWIYPYKLDFHRVRGQVDPDRAGYPPETPDEFLNVLEKTDVHWKCETCWYFQNRGLEHLVNDVYLLGVDHLVGEVEDG